MNWISKIANELNVIGLMNAQLALKNEELYVLEVNPRASRTVPFVAKSIGIPIGKIAAKIMAGKSLSELAISGTPAVLVPYPSATDHHQDFNAAFAAEIGAAVIVHQHKPDKKYKYLDFYSTCGCLKHLFVYLNKW